MPVADVTHEQLRQIVIVSAQDDRQVRAQAILDCRAADVHRVADLDLYFVRLQSPVVEVLRRNQHVLQLDLDNAQPVNDQYYVVASNVVLHIVNEARAILGRPNRPTLMDDDD